MKTYSSALKWFEKKTGKPIIESILRLYRDNPAGPALETCPEEHPSLDGLSKSLETRIQSDDKSRKLIRDFSLLIDYRWMTEELGEDDLETRIKLSEKYCVELFEIHRLLHEMLR